MATYCKNFPSKIYVILSLINLQYMSLFRVYNRQLYTCKSFYISNCENFTRVQHTVWLDHRISCYHSKYSSLYFSISSTTSWKNCKAKKLDAKRCYDYSYCRLLRNAIFQASGLSFPHLTSTVMWRRNSTLRVLSTAAHHISPISLTRSLKCFWPWNKLASVITGKRETLSCWWFFLQDIFDSF